MSKWPVLLCCLPVACVTQPNPRNPPLIPLLHPSPHTVNLTGPLFCKKIFSLRTVASYGLWKLLFHSFTLVFFPREGLFSRLSMNPDVFFPDLSSMWELWGLSVKPCVDFSMCMYSYAASVWLVPSVPPSAPVSSTDVLMDQEQGKKVYNNCAHSFTYTGCNLEISNKAKDTFMTFLPN